MVKEYDVDGAKYKFYKVALPEGEKFTRVHAVIVTRDGRILLRVKGGDCRGTTGGHIEAYDLNVEAALRREILEEIQCKIDRCDYIGYLEVIEEDGTRELWARMVARLEEVLPAQSDPDREDHWTYGRVLAPVEIATVEATKQFPLNAEQFQEALKIAREKEYFTELPNLEYEVLNVESRDE